MEINQIKLDEGFSEKVYECSEGYLTIGYGLNLESGITEEEAEAILQIRLDKVEQSLKENLPWFVRAHSEVQGVLLNMAYQMGVSGLLKFKNALKALEEQRYIKAGDEMLDSRWAKQTPQRATRLASRIASL